MDLHRAIVAIALFIGSLTAVAQLPPPDDAVRTEKVTEGVYVLFGRGGNIGVSVGPDGVFLIDDQYAPATPQIQAAVAELAPGPIRFVLNTHWHGDHTGGNENLGNAGAVIVAHDNVRTRMSVPQMLEFFKRAVPASPPGALPVITFNDAVSFHLNGDEIRAVHVARAHTDTDILVQFRKANVLHAGDLYFNGSYPFIDVDSGGSVPGLITAVDRLLELADAQTRIIPGHGPMASRGDLQGYRDMLATTTGRVRALVEAGKSADEIVAAAPNADYDGDWASGFINGERYVRMLVRAMEME